MIDFLSFLVILIIGLTIGFFVCKIVLNTKKQSEKLIADEKLNNASQQLLAQSQLFITEKTSLNTQIKTAISEIEKLRIEKDVVRNEKEVIAILQTAAVKIGDWPLKMLV